MARRRVGAFPAVTIGDFCVGEKEMIPGHPGVRGVSVAYRSHSHSAALPAHPLSKCSSLEKGTSVHPKIYEVLLAVVTTLSEVGQPPLHQLSHSSSSAVFFGASFSC